MLGKALILFCILESISSQYIGAAYNPAGNVIGLESPCASAAWNAGLYASGAPLAGPWAAAPMAGSPYINAEYAAGYSPASFSVSNGGGFTVTSVSPIAPTGITMTSENAYEGPLTITGSIPFLGAVALEGTLPTAGSGAVTYGCGNGNVAMLSEDVSPVGYNGLPGAYGYGPGVPELGYGYGSPLAYEAGLMGPSFGGRGCGCNLKK